MRVGIVGAGTMGAVQAAAWRSTEARLIGCVSAQQSQSDQLAALREIRATTLLSIYWRTSILLVSAPPLQRKSMVLEAAQAGKHVLCEKPIALRQEDGEAMIQACQKAGV